MRCIINAILLVSAMLASTPILHAATTAGQWVAHSPGTLTLTQATERGPKGKPAQVITFTPDTVHTDAYWCEVALECATPLSDNVVTCNLKASAPGIAHIKISDTAGHAAYYNVAVITGWCTIELRRENPDSLEGGPLENITRVAFIYNNGWYTPGDRFSLYFSDMQFLQRNHTTYLNRNWMPATVPPPVDGYRIETCIWNTWTPGSGWGTGDAEFNGFDQPQGMQVARDVMTHLIKEYKNVAIDMPYVSGEQGKQLCDYFSSLGGLPLAEGHNAFSREWLTERNALALNIHGQNVWEAGLPDTTVSHDMTNPAVLQGLQERLLASAKAGAKAWRTVDYVWPWWGGPVWGYSDAAITRWRENLNETDTGIEIIENGKHRFAHFMEYFASYHGYTPQPSELGLTSWNEYTPPRDGAADSPQLENNRKIFGMLFHYEWVKFINEASRPSAPYGLLAQPICNPESFNNGTDLYWLLRCAYVRGFAAEWWGGANIVVPNYYNGRYYDNVGRKNGKELVNLGESAAAGGSPFWGKLGRPHYWDNMANYLINYCQSGSVDFKAKHDQYWGSSWKKMSDPNGREYQSFTAFRSAWAGFLQCRNDKALKPKTDMLAITLRSVSRSTSPFDQGYDDQPFNLGRDVERLNYLHDGAAFPVDEAFDLNDYKTIVYTPYEAPKGYVSKLAGWLAAKPGRTLITHSFIPTRFSGPAGVAPQGAVEALQTGGQEKQLGFTGITVSTLTSGIVTTNSPIFQRALRDFVGKRINLTSGVYNAPGGKVLVSIGGKPLITERTVGKGRVIYLHYCPSASAFTGTRITAILDQAYQSDQFERAIMDGILRYLGYRPTAITPDGFFALPFDTADGRVFITFNSNAPTDMQYGDEVFPVYQAQNPAVTGKAMLAVAKRNAKYRVIDMITGASQIVTSDAEGYLPVALDGWNMRGVRIAPAR